MHTGDYVLAMDNDLHVIFGKGPDGLAVPNDAEGHAHVEEEIYILGPTLLERPRDPLFDRGDARDEKP